MLVEWKLGKPKPPLGLCFWGLACAFWGRAGTRRRDPQLDDLLSSSCSCNNYYLHSEMVVVAVASRQSPGGEKNAET